MIRLMPYQKDDDDAHDDENEDEYDKVFNNC